MVFSKVLKRKERSMGGQGRDRGGRRGERRRGGSMGGGMTECGSNKRRGGEKKDIIQYSIPSDATS